MSEKSASRGEQGIDRLLAEAGLDEAYEIRNELLELRALANSRPQPSAEVLALMVPGAAVSGVSGGPVGADAPDATTTTLAHSEAAPVDELAARRRRKRRAGIAAFAVAASLAAGATAAAASEGGIPGTIEHLGAVVGTVVSQLAPSSGDKGQQQPGTSSEPGPAPARGSNATAKPTPAPSSPDAPRSSELPTPRESYDSTGSGAPSDLHKGLDDLSKGKPGPVTIPSTPVVPSPHLPLPQPVPSELLPENPVKP